MFNCYFFEAKQFKNQKSFRYFCIVIVKIISIVNSLLVISLKAKNLEKQLKGYSEIIAVTTPSIFRL